MSLRAQYDILRKWEKHNFNWDVIVIQFSIDSQTLDVIDVDSRNWSWHDVPSTHSSWNETEETHITSVGFRVKKRIDFTATASFPMKIFVFVFLRIRTLFFIMLNENWYDYIF